MKKSQYGYGIAARNASKREGEIIKILESSNILKYYAPYACSFAFISFFLWCYIWSYYQDIIVFCGGQEISQSNKTCSSSSVLFDDESFRYVSIITSSILFSFFLTQLLQLLDFETRNSFRVTAVYCTAVINLIASISHYSMAKGWFPAVINLYGRISHVARWGEWVSLVPLLMIMMTSLDVRNVRERQLIVEASTFQLVSVFLGGIANLSSNYNLSVVFSVVSTVLYLHLYYVLWRSLRRYNKLLKESNARASRRDESDQPSGITTKEAASHVELLAATMSVKLALVCAVTWTLKLVIYALGTANALTQTQEAIIQSLTDCVSKGIYARTLCTSHGMVMSPEGLLRRMLLLEEQANASIRQVLLSVLF